MIGRRVSHYEIQEELGRGGMGVVFKARDTRLDREVALKFLPQHLTSDASARERFIREARTASSLDHQHICTIHDIGESDDGQTYIVMAYYSGRTLKEKIDDGPLELSEAVSVAVQVADGLAAAHRKGIVHRDVKPGNVIVTEEGVAKILDFGLAKLAGAAVELTAEDSTLGTAAYMSPEQARGDDLDARSDVWSLGVMLYEMLAGRRPFAADYEQALIYGILNEEPAPVQSSRPDVPDDLAEVVARALDKDPDRRYASASDLAADLRAGSIALSSSVGIPTASGSIERRNATAAPKRAMLIGAAAAVILVAALAFWLLRPSSGGGPGTERSLVAVMPFSIQGDKGLQYLETGMVDLLTRKLDGAGTLRGVDPNALIGRLGDEVHGIRDPGEAQTVASGFGAGQFILGSITKIGASIQLDATLYDVAGSVVSEAQTSAAEEEDLMSSIDALAQQLIADQLTEAGQGLDRTAALTSSSLPALKAFLEGERALAEGRFGDAVTFLRSAVELDSTFALAWYRLRDAMGWAGQVGSQDREKALDKAFAHSDRLPADVVRMLEAEKASNEARFDDARAIYEELVRQQPDNVNAWLKLGDLIFHYGDREGYPSVLAREPFERALSLNPENREGQYHLITIAAKERDSTRLATLLESYGEALAENPTFYIGNRIAGGAKPEGAFLDEVAQMAASNPGILMYAALTSATVSENLSEAQQWADLFRDQDPDNPSFGGPSLFLLMVAGKATESISESERLQQDASYADSLTGTVFDALMAVSPLDAVPEEDLADARTLLETANADSIRQSVLPRPLRGQEGVLATYASALLSYRFGDFDDVAIRTEALAEMPYEGDGPNLAYHSSHMIRALMEWRKGNTSEALGHLDDAHYSIHWRYRNNPFVGEVFNRWVRAEILRETGRLEEALSYYSTLSPTMEIFGLLYLGPSYLRRGEVHEALGNDVEAIDFYSRLIELWKDADPKYQASVDQARAGIERILDKQAREAS